MGNGQSPMKINYVDMQNAIANKNSDVMIINTLKDDEQQCLISHTCLASYETKKINDLLTQSSSSHVNIFIYGKHNDDSSILDKYMQLKKLGFRNVYIYTGGLFEWLLLQDIYGHELFPTTSKCTDFLRFCSTSQF